MHAVCVIPFLFVVCKAVPLQLSDISSEYAIVDLSDVTVSHMRHRRQSSGDVSPCQLKDELILPITYKNNQKTLTLTRDEKHSPDRIPVLQVNADGILSVKPKTIQNRVSAMYYYEEDMYRYGIMVTCQFTETCESTCEIRGDLLTDDELVEIAGSVEDKNLKDSKLLDGIPHVVKTIPNTEYKSFGTQDDMREAGLDRNGNPDPNLPPILTKKERKEFESMLSTSAAMELKNNIELAVENMTIGEAISEVTEESTGTETEETKKGWLQRLLNRYKRQIPAQASWFQINEDVIELMMTNDVQFFNSFKNFGGKPHTDDEAMVKMIEYMAIIAAGIDNRFYNIRNYAPDIKLRVHLTGILPMTAVSEATSWADHDVTIDGEGPFFDADSAVDSFSSFVYSNRYLFSEFDHVMGITGQDLVRYVPSLGTWEKGILGYTFFNGVDGIMCRQPYYSVSVVEAPAIGVSSRIGTHEIAHNMRVRHDTINSPAGCHQDDQYIMAEAVQPAGSQSKTHPYEFSTCAIENIREHLRALDDLILAPDNTETNLRCMKHQESNQEIFGAYDGKVLAGQIYDLDMQCKYLMRDPLSSLCVKPRPSYCWDAIYCTWPSVDQSYCYSGYSYNGSPCNATSICFEGECTPIA